MYVYNCLYHYLFISKSISYEIPACCSCQSLLNPYHDPEGTDILPKHALGHVDKYRITLDENINAEVVEHCVVDAHPYELIAASLACGYGGPDITLVVLGMAKGMSLEPAPPPRPNSRALKDGPGLQATAPTAVCLPACLPACLPVCLSVCCLSVCLSASKLENEAIL